MRRITSLMSQWKADIQSGEGLHFELCKGGYFSNKDEYGLKVVGKTAQDTLSGKNLLNTNREIVYCSWNSDTTLIRSFDDTKAYKEMTVTNLSANQFTTVVKDGDRDFVICSTNQGYGLAFPAKVLQNTTYTVSKEEGDEIGVGFYTEDGSLISYITPAATFTTPANCYWANIILRPAYAAGECLYKNIQLELGSTATDYEEYCGGIPSPNPEYPMPIQCVKQGTKVICGSNEITTPCDLYEEDIWYPMSGKIERHNYKYTYTGTEHFYTWVSGGTFLGYYIPRDFLSSKYYPVSPQSPFSNYFSKTNASGTQLPAALNNKITIHYNQIYFGTADFGVDGSTNNFKQWIADKYSEGNPLILIFKLITPIIEQYEPQPIFALQGEVNVIQQATDLSANLSATMLVRG